MSKEIAEKLTKAEAKTLADCESQIGRGMASFIEVGNALKEVRESRLYRVDYKTFEEYCETRWDIGRSYAHRQIEAATVVKSVANWQQIPASESQCRELAKAGESAEKVWKAALKRAPKLADGTAAVTAELVAKVRDELLNGQPAAPPAPKKEDKRTAFPYGNNANPAEEIEDDDPPLPSVPDPQASDPPAETNSDPHKADREACLAFGTRLHSLATQLGEIGNKIQELPHAKPGYSKLPPMTATANRLYDLSRSVHAIASDFKVDSPGGECGKCLGVGTGCTSCGGTGVWTVGQINEHRNAQKAMAS